MKRIIFSFVLAGMLSVLSGAAIAGDSPVRWHNDVNSALQDARASHRPVMVFVTAKWCHFCQKMEHETFSNAAIARKMNDSFVPLWVDADEQPELVEKLKVESMPAMLFFQPDGKMIERAGGFMPVPEIGRLLDKASR